MKFNDIIRQAMQNTSTTQQDLGDKLGVRQNAIANTVARPGISLDKFVTIMDALGYEIAVRPKNDRNSEEILTTRATEPSNQ